MGDGDLIRSALDNLITNAMESIGERDGSITLRVKTDPVRFIECENTGSCIDPEIQHKIFRINYTTKEHGSGFGLYYVQKVMSSHSGSVEFDSDNITNITRFRMVFNGDNSTH